MFALRFTNDIKRDIAKGKSEYFTTGEELEGLCVWSLSIENPDPSISELRAVAQKFALNQVLSNGYGGYSSDTDYAIVEGRYVGSNNDGVLIEVERVICTDSISHLVERDDSEFSSYSLID